VGVIYAVYVTLPLNWLYLHNQLPFHYAPSLSRMNSHTSLSSRYIRILQSATGYIYIEEGTFRYTFEMQIYPTDIHLPCSRNFEGLKDRVAARKRTFERKTDVNEHLMNT